MKFGDSRLPSAVAIATFIAAVPGVTQTLRVGFTDNAVSGLVKVLIGSPGETYSLIFDPASSNTWVGATKLYTKTSSSQSTGKYVAVSYGSGEFKGEEYDDLVTLDGITFNQSIGAATSSQGITDADGLLGLGPIDLTKSTIIQDPSETIPTVLDNLVAQGQVKGSAMTIANYSITFGSVDPIGDVIYSPITTRSPANTFWGLDASFEYGTSSLVPQTAGIIDHGSTLTLLASSSYQSFLDQTKATLDSAAGLPVLPSCEGMQPIVLKLAGGDISIDVAEYRWPADKNTDIGGQAGKCYLAVGDLGSDFENLHSGPGPQFRSSAVISSAADTDHLKFILGYTTLKHYTVVLDKDGSRIGISKSVVV